jgi:hypothetical protein
MAPHDDKWALVEDIERQRNWAPWINSLVGYDPVSARIQFLRRYNEITDDLVTIEVCAAGLVRNAIALRVAKKIGGLLHEFEPVQAHEFTAKHYEHTAACERWEARLGALTGSEHSHATPITTAPPDDR